MKIQELFLFFQTLTVLSCTQSFVPHRLPSSSLALSSRHDLFQRRLHHPATRTQRHRNHDDLTVTGTVTGISTNPRSFLQRMANDDNFRDQEQNHHSIPGKLRKRK
jgi:hypothetical protein